MTAHHDEAPPSSLELDALIETLRNSIANYLATGSGRSADDVACTCYDDSYSDTFWPDCNTNWVG